MIKEKSDILKEIISSSHHAFIIETDTRDKLFSFFQTKLNFNKNLFLNLQVFDIAKAKEVLEYGKMIFNDQSFIVISFYSINREAQNSLLKFLEEAPKNLKIILIVHSGAKILNTIYSRVYRLSYFENENNKNIYENLAKDFLNTKNLARMKMKEIVDLLEKKDEYALEVEDKERQDREAVELFLISLSKELYEKLKFAKDKEERNLLENNLLEINEFLKYIKNNSSSAKTILEYLSLKL